MMARKVLLTGAGGRIGTAFRAFVGDRYDLRLVDRDASKIEDAGDYEVIEADLSDLAECQKVCAGMDTVVHMAGNPNARADFYEGLMDDNVKACYNIFRAAKDQGCRRVIWASGIQVIEGYPLDVQARPESPIKPMNMYAAAKAFGEAIAHYFAYAEGLSCIAVRVGAFEGNRPLEKPDGRTLSAFVSKRDLSHLLAQCIEAEGVQFAIVHGVSDNRFKRMDITSTRALVDYHPVDDAFAKFDMGVTDTPRWMAEFDRGADRNRGEGQQQGKGSTS
jgi:nucleoside-diphosphate-sugar epimerase